MSDNLHACASVMKVLNVGSKYVVCQNIIITQIPLVTYLLNIGLHILQKHLYGVTGFLEKAFPNGIPSQTPQPTQYHHQISIKSMVT